MKRIYIAFACLGAMMNLQAQDTYLNDRVTNNSDVIGTARYVGMGGAMGALGADISVMSNNPAGIGLMSRSNIAISMGGQIQDEAPAYGDSRGTFTFDQLGLVFAIDDDGMGNRLNVGFNYQKKINFNHSLYTSQALNKLSQADMFAWIAGSIESFDNNNNFLGFKNPLYNGLEAKGLFSLTTDGSGKAYYKASEAGQTGNYYRYTTGSLQGYEFNISGSIQNRWFLGLTMGLDRLSYTANASYNEICEDPKASYILYQDQELRGTGFNFKLGAIGRPIEDSPFRIGVAVETPTWYTFKHNSWPYVSFVDAATDRYAQALDLSKDYTMYDKNQDNFNNYLEYNVYSPWKFRASIGSTIEDIIAWDIEYEYSLNNWTKMGYPRETSYDYYNDGSSVAMDKDRPMNDLTHRNVRGVHNIRAGVEVRPIPELALRTGYNFYSRPFEKNARLDQTCDSYAMYYSTSTEYINLGDTHIFTVGLGYQGKHFYADLVYKYRAQKGDFYAFDDYFTSDDEHFKTDNPTLKDVQLQGTEVNLDRHNFAVTLGFRF